MIIIISGLAGSGKSTLAKGFGKELGLPVIHASGILKQLGSKGIEEIDAKKAKAGRGFWESGEGKEMIKKRLADNSMDKALDKKLLEIIENGNAVIDSKTMGYLSRRGIKIWIECGIETRARRISSRDSITKKIAEKKISERDNTDKKIYKELYGFELGKNLEKFDLVLNNENLSAEQTLKKAIAFIKRNQESV